MTGLLLFGAEGRMGREVAALAAQYAGGKGGGGD